MVSGAAMPKIWRQIAMDISVTAAKPGRRRYLTLIDDLHYRGDLLC